MLLKEFEGNAKKLNELTTFKAAEDSKRLSRPQTPEAYEAKLPADFQLPQGVTYAIDANDPMLAQGRQLMHEIDQGKLSGQEAFSKMLGLYAGMQINSETQIAAARTAEVAKLGATGPSRIDTIKTFYRGLYGNDADAEAEVSRIFTAADVLRHEKKIARYQQQGGATFTQTGRDAEPAGKVSDADYEKMTFAEKRQYAEKFSNGKAA